MCYSAFGHLSIRIQNSSTVLMGNIMGVMMSVNAVIFVYWLQFIYLFIYYVFSRSIQGGY